jgi:transcriptional adapter 2-alpha
MDKLNFPIFSPEWKASEELLLLEGIEMYGLGNWVDIAEHVGTKNGAACEQHYFSSYIDTAGEEAEDGRDYEEGEEAEGGGGSAGGAGRRGRAGPSVPVDAALGSGWMPKRRELETEYDNDAEFLLADLQFFPPDPCPPPDGYSGPLDSPALRELKVQMLHFYNSRLDVRYAMRNFVADNDLLDVKKVRPRPLRPARTLWLTHPSHSGNKRNGANAKRTKRCIWPPAHSWHFPTKTSTRSFCQVSLVSS